MRVVAGTARGRRLKAPEDRLIRPSTDRIRESIFDLLGPGHLAERVLDAFAGTGALGIEALSRGVERGTFVDRDAKALALVRENLKLCRLSERAELLRADALTLLRSRAADFDLVLLDPSYAQGLALDSLEILGQSSLVVGCRVVCECEAVLDLPESMGCLTRIKQRRYGDTQVGVYEHRVDR